MTLFRRGENALATISIATDLSRAYPIGEDKAGYGFPAVVEYGIETYDFADTSSPPNFQGIGNVAVKLVHDGVISETQIPSKISKGIAKFLCTANWGDKDCDCTAFALAATDLKLGQIIEPTQYTPVTNTAQLQSGDLLAVGTVNHGNRDIDHFALSIGGGEMALNVTGMGGVLAATPVNLFPAIYPRRSLYVVGGGGSR